MKAVHINRISWLHLILGLVAMILLFKTTYSSRAIESQYQINDDSYFNHMVYDTKRSSLFCGAMNRIIQLGSNLSVKSIATTGPRPDSPACHAGGCSKDVDNVVDTNNFNKILILNNRGNPEKEKDTLIACGSLHQGSCIIFDSLDEFPKYSRFIELPLVANDENSSSYAFIGPSKYTVWVS